MTDTFFEYLGWVSLSPNLKESFNKGLLDAKQQRHGTVEIEHLLFALVDDPEGAITLTQLGIDRDDLRDELADHLDAIPTGAKKALEELQPARALKKLMAKASDLADNEHDDTLDGGDVVKALVQFKASPNLNALIPRQSTKDGDETPKRHARSRPRNQARNRPTKNEPLPPQAGDPPMENSTSNSKPDGLNFDADPIKASIKAIMARRADAEQILNECEWYHLFKSLNMIDEGLEGEEHTHRAILLARAEAELAERPRCRKAFLYVRHLDKELARLKGIVDIDWAGDISPDETVQELARMRATTAQNTNLSSSSTHADQGAYGAISKQLFDVKVQESEVLALEQKLMRLDKSAGGSADRLKKLESHIESHDTHSKKRENVIGELERYLRSEMQLSDARDKRILQLEEELHSSKSISDSQVDKTSHLEHELAAFKEHAGNREMLISDLEAKLKAEKTSAGSHEEQALELRTMLENEKTRAASHDKHIEELQKTYEKEKTRAAAHENQVLALEQDLKSRMVQIQAREEQVKQLEADLSTHQSKRTKYKQELHTQAANHQSEVQKLVTDISDKEGQSRVHQQEINALRAQLGNLENRLQDQETAYSVEKVNLANVIDEMRREIEESEDLIEIIHAVGEPYTVNSNGRSSDTIQRRTIPVAKRHDS